ncbi:MAG TPA: AbrB/MazE/SpoVT family DNA-binding domain-containing protein [Candidatus Lokiarchaeia archaeon]|nr:AbrB/MazE/SpoVT family DNA-binding domain-containing protein [Candidatus Lokiarchaeia archaeon]
MIEQVVKVTNKGMISIPAVVRKKYHISDGDYVIVKEDEMGNINIIPIESAEELRKSATTMAEFKAIFAQSRKEDLEFER